LVDPAKPEDQSATGDESLNEERIQQIVKIEQQVQEIHDKAHSEAEMLPLQAEQEANAMIEKARAEAEQEAKKMLENARADDEVARILSQAEEQSKLLENKAMNYVDRAVNYILARVVGRE
jgi:V/A-type H+-transporting ATPase subunit G/H